MAGRAPAYTSISNDQNGAADGSWTWSAFILPYIEQSALYDSFQPGTIMYSDATTNNSTVQGGVRRLQNMMKQPLGVYVCPSDGGDAMIPNTPDAGDNNNGWYMESLMPNNNGGQYCCWAGAGADTVFRANYLANHMSFRRDWWQPFDREFPGLPNAVPVFDGLFGVNSSIRFRDVSDGLSNTIALGERTSTMNSTQGMMRCLGARPFGVANSHAPNDWNGFHNWAGAFGTGGHLINDSTSDTSAPRNDWNCRRGYSSSHEGGMQVVMGDGAVRFISENIHQNFNSNVPPNATFQNLLSRNDGRVVGEF